MPAVSATVTIFRNLCVNSALDITLNTIKEKRYSTIAKYYSSIKHYFFKETHRSALMRE